MTHKELYKFAYKFLLSKDNVTDDLIKRHCKPEYNKPRDIHSIFKRLCETAQNRQMSSRVIGYSIGGIDNLRKVLNDFDPKYVASKYSKHDTDKLLETIIKELKPKGQVRNTSRSIWPQFCKTIIDASHFLCEFRNVKSFYDWIEFFANDEKAKPALPMLISVEISGLGFPLACDFLKEIGYINFGKPDVHIKDIFKALNLVDSKEKSTLKLDFQTLKAIDIIAKENNITAFEVDKIFWLIGSGKFYLTDINIGRNKKEFIKLVKKHYAQHVVASTAVSCR